jgi:GntR family transcriptional repressor for pyruvate dehydrogenase complex
MPGDKPTGGSRSRSGNGDRPKKAAILIAHQIVHDITDEELPVGTMLPNETDLADKYGVARATLREALRYLEFQGVVSMRTGPHGGPMVAKADYRPLASTFALLLERTKMPFGHLVDARLTLEPMLARQAAKQISDDQIDELRASHETMVANLTRSEAFLAENHRFHELIAAASGNQIFEYLLSSLHWITDSTPMGVNYGMQTRKAILAAHKLIVDALANRDVDASERAMFNHVNEFAKYLAKNRSGVDEETIRWSGYYT